jgi:hypothetical protein
VPAGRVDGVGVDPAVAVVIEPVAQLWVAREPRGVAVVAVGPGDVGLPGSRAPLAPIDQRSGRVAVAVGVGVALVAHAALRAVVVAAVADDGGVERVHVGALVVAVGVVGDEAWAGAGRGGVAEAVAVAVGEAEGVHVALHHEPGAHVEVDPVVVGGSPEADPQGDRAVEHGGAGEVEEHVVGGEGGVDGDHVEVGRKAVDGPADRRERGPSGGVGPAVVAHRDQRHRLLGDQAELDVDVGICSGVPRHVTVGQARAVAPPRGPREQRVGRHPRRHRRGGDLRAARHTGVAVPTAHGEPLGQGGPPRTGHGQRREHGPP